MNELQFYKFIETNSVEWHSAKIDGENDVLIFLAFSEIESFCKLLGWSVFDEDGISCTMKNGYFAIPVKDICEHYGLDFEKIFIGSDSNH